MPYSTSNRSRYCFYINSRLEPKGPPISNQASRRALSVEELAYLSAGDPEDCQVFLQMLQGFDLLERVARPAAAAKPVTTAHVATRVSSGSDSALSRVVRGLRLRLGLA